MQGFRDWLLSEEKIPQGAIKLHLPKVRQQKTFTCGAAALKAVCKYFKVGPEKESDFSKVLGTNSEAGTMPEKIEGMGKLLGLNPKSMNLTVQELVKHLQAGRPVICCMQAWGEPKDYKKLESGHYVVAIGYKNGRIYFEDPAMDGGVRGYLPVKEFDRRWNDRDYHGHSCNHLGIIFTRGTPQPDDSAPRHAKKIK
jgi:predicted double-glycine peptidase